MEADNLAQNHTTMNGIDGEIAAPQAAAKSDNCISISQSLKPMPLLNGDSSDSEGPLPEIDSGFSDDDESEVE